MDMAWVDEFLASCEEDGNGMGPLTVHLYDAGELVRAVRWLRDGAARADTAESVVLNLLSRFGPVEWAGMTDAERDLMRRLS